jgi:hypothetical protein
MDLLCVDRAFDLSVDTTPARDSELSVEFDPKVNSLEILIFPVSLPFFFNLVSVLRYRLNKVSCN